MDIKKLVDEKVEPYHPRRASLAPIITGLLALWNKEKNHETMLFRSVYYALDKLAQKHPEHFARVRFSKVGKEPHSEQIEDTLFRMGAFGLFSVENPKLEYCQMPKNMTEVVLKDLQEVHGKAFVDELEPLCKEFTRYIEEYKRS